MRKVRILTMLALIAMLPATAAFAFTSEFGESVSVSTPVTDNLYVAGSRVSVQSSITNDLTMAWADISNAGSVSGGILAAGANIDISGKVGDNLRVAGANIKIRSTIAGDAVIAWGNIDIKNDTVISKDLVVAAGNVYFDGNTKGKALIRAWKVYLNGVIEKDADIIAGEVVIGSGAEIRWNLRYEGAKKNDQLEAITVGQKQFKENENLKKDGKREIFAFAAGYILWKILFLVVFAFLLLAFMEKYVHETSDILKKQPWISLFVGISFFVLLPIIALLLAITIIGLPVAALLITILVFAFVFYELIGVTIWSSWILDHYMKGKKEVWWKKLLVVLGLAVLFALISGFDIIPAWIAIGALLTRHWQLMESIRK